MAGPKPLTAQRSPWERRGDVVFGGVVTQRWHRQVGDGVLTSFVALEPQGWHLSISHHGRRLKSGRPMARYPTWDEITHARYELLPDDITVAMLLPPPVEYVASHPTTFHLHEVAL
jgi:hypothetical protein